MSAMNIEPGLDPADFPEYGAPTLAGDHSDDDGQVIDSLFVEVDTPPTPPADTPAITHRTMPRRTNQLIEGFQVIDLNNLNTPMRLLNADPDRKDTIVRVNGTVATDSIRIADEPSKLSYPPAGGTSGVAGRVFVSGQWNPSDYTGAVWVIGTDITAPVVVSYWAVSD